MPCALTTGGGGGRSTHDELRWMADRCGAARSLDWRRRSYCGGDPTGALTVLSGRGMGESCRSGGVDRRSQRGCLCRGGERCRCPPVCRMPAQPAADGKPSGRRGKSAWTTGRRRRHASRRQRNSARKRGEYPPLVAAGAGGNITEQGVEASRRMALICWAGTAAHPGVAGRMRDISTWPKPKASCCST